MSVVSLDRRSPASELPGFDFELPQASEAHEPVEERGLARDEVRLMVATRSDGKLVHARFRELPRHLAPGDRLVLNVSAPIPAAVPALRADGTALELRLSTPRSDDHWLVELRLGPAPFAHGEPGERLPLPPGGRERRVGHEGRGGWRAGWAAWQ